MNEEPASANELPPDRLRELAAKGSEKAKERNAKDREQARERKKTRIAADKQLTLWSDSVRGAPNELVRSALFAAKNRNHAREYLRASVVAMVGDGVVTYTGEELRQDDETVWLQLVHLARANGLSTAFQFTPYGFCKSINWPINGQSFDRLSRCMTRMQATSLKVSSARLGEEISISMLPGYKANRRKDGTGGLWTVHMHEELVFLFAGFQYTRLEWEQRLALPEGLATWMHAYYASHSEPFDVKVETLAIGAALLPSLPETEAATKPDAARKARLRDVKKLILNALTALKEVGFLTSFEVSSSGLVKVCRAIK